MIQSLDPNDPNWADDHRNLSMVADYMFELGSSKQDVVYMLEKPWKFVDEYQAALEVLASDGRS